MTISPELLVTRTVPNRLVRFLTDFFTVVLGFDFRNPASSMLVLVLVSYDKNHRKFLPFGKINVQQRKHPVQLSVHILGLEGLFGVNESQ